MTTNTPSALSPPSAQPPSTLQPPSPPPPPLPTYPRVFASLDALFSVVLAIFIGGAAKAITINVGMDAIGFAQSLSPILVLSLVYGSRFGSPIRALMGTGVSLLPSRHPPRLLWVHLLQLLILLLSWPTKKDFATLSMMDTSSQILSCASTTSIVWAPAFEEITFRFVAFYVTLNRSGGDLPFAALVSACLFGAIHIANVYATGAMSLYAWLQVLQASIAGWTWTLVFVRTGSIMDTILLHAANNLVAVVYLSREVSSGASKTCSDAMSSTFISQALLASLLLQVSAYLIESLLSWSSLQAIASNADGALSLRELHPIMYYSKSKDRQKVKES